MVGIVLVSHSRTLALAVQELVRAMTGPALPLAIAAGAGENHAELGTDAVEISEAIVSVRGPDGVLVLMDMGSAILSSETALDLLSEEMRANVRFCPAPFVEGAVAAGVTANLGASLDEVCAEARAALKQKQTALAPNQPDATPEAAPAATKEGDKAKVVRLTVRNPHGLHARPAARLITETRPFHAEITLRNLTNHRGPVSIRSLSSLASLEILQGNEIEVSAVGDDASSALEKVTQLVESGLGDDLSAPDPGPANGSANGSSNGNGNGNGVALLRNGKFPRPASRKIAVPMPASSGIAFGRTVYFQDEKPIIPQGEVDDVEAEIKHLEQAIAAAQKQLEARRSQMSAAAGAANAGIYEAQILALQDPELIEPARRIIRQEKANAALAWHRANQEVVDRYQALSDRYLRERAADIEDVGRQVLELLGVERSGGLRLAEPSILIAPDLSPFQVSTLPKKMVLGVILLHGGPTAHSSILLRALGIPAVVQAAAYFSNVDLKKPGIIAFDGSTGRIWLHPDSKLLAELAQRQAEERRLAEEERRASMDPGATMDGHRIEMFANIGNASEVEAALASGAEGVGLFRTEFLFLDRDSAPTEEEQVQALTAAAEKMGGRPVIIRTLDAGGDKQIPYLQMPAEQNPFLGVRAIRLCFTHQELFAGHLRAILRAGYQNDFRIMFPMIANVDDLKHVKEFLDCVHRDLERHNVPHLWPILTGIMIEIPSAALQAGMLAEQADFFSIGTNDLTQYTLAADRGNSELAAYQDSLHPSVLSLIHCVVAGASQYNRLVAVCGEAASDEASAAIFAGLGVRELSMSPAKIPHIKAMLRKWNLADLQQLASRAFSCRNAAEVRALFANR